MESSTLNQGQIAIINPTATRSVEQTKLAPRQLKSLRGRRVGLLDNNKPNADKFLGYVGELLNARYDGIELVAKRKMSRTEADCLPELRSDCEVVINAFAD
jgi:hypothetical protein